MSLEHNLVASIRRVVKRENEREREQSKGMARIASILESSQHTVSWSVGRARPKALDNKPPSLIHSIKLSRGNNTKSSNNYKPVTTLAPRKLRSTRPHSGARRQDILHQTFTTFALLSMSLQPPFLAAQRRRSTGFFTFYNLSSLSLSLPLCSSGRRRFKYLFTLSQSEEQVVDGS